MPAAMPPARLPSFSSRAPGLLDIGLVRSDLVLPDELLDTPIGKAAWLPAVREFRWDQPYTERYKQRYKQAVKAAGRK